MIFEQPLRFCRVPFSVVLSLALLCGEAAGAAWEIVPRVGFGPLFETNPGGRGGTTKEESALGALIDAKLNMAVYNQRTSASLNPRVLFRFYTRDVNKQLEDKNYSIGGNVNHRMMRANAGLNANYSDLSLRTVEQDLGGGSGLPIFRESNQQRAGISPYFSYQLTGADSVSLNGSFSKVSFSPPVAFRFDFESSSLSAGLSHQFNYKNAVSIRANFSQFDAEPSSRGTKNDSTTTGLSLAFNNAVSDTLTASASGGWARTRSEITRQILPPGLLPVLKTDVTNFVGNLSLHKQSENVNYSAGIGQSVSPSSQGTEVVRRFIRGRMARSHTAHFSTSLGVSAYEQTSALPVSFLERDFVGLVATADWSFALEWSVTGRYGFSYSRTTTNDLLTALPSSRTSNNNHSFFIGVSYRGQGWRN